VLFFLASKKFTERLLLKRNTGIFEFEKLTFLTARKVIFFLASKKFTKRLLPKRNTGIFEFEKLTFLYLQIYFLVLLLKRQQ
jgi:hypothetical protein